jgi:hypothetical protein
LTGQLAKVSQDSTEELAFRSLDWTVGERESGLHRRTGIKGVLTGQLAKESQDSTEELALKRS